MGQALPKHHWHEADKFLVAAQLHVPQAQPQQQHPHHHQHQQTHPNQGAPATNVSPVLSLSNGGALSTPKAAAPVHYDLSQLASSPPPPSDDEDEHDEDLDQTTLHHTSSGSSSSSSSFVSSDASSEAAPASSYDDDDDDDDAVHDLSALPYAAALALASANWLRVIALARGFERVYAGCLDAWVAATPAPSTSISGISTNTSTTSTRTHPHDGEEGSVKRRGRAKVLSASWKRRHATTLARAHARTWTAADLVDLATRGGPLRWYRWHSGGEGREGKERGRRQLTDDAVRMGWCGGLVVERLLAPSPSSSPSPSPSPSASTSSDPSSGAAGAAGDQDAASGEEPYRAHIDPDTGLLSAVAVRCGADGRTTLRVADRVLAFVKVCTILFPPGPPWVVAAAAGPSGAGAPVADGFGTRAAERDRHHRRVWVAMALGWAWCLEAWLAAHAKEQEVQGSGDGEGQGMGFDVGGFCTDVVSDLEGLGNNAVDDEVDEEQLEEMSEVDIEDEDLLAALARAADERRESLIPSDGEDDDDGGGGGGGAEGGGE